MANERLKDLKEHATSRVEDMIERAYNLGYEDCRRDLTFHKNTFN